MPSLFVWLLKRCAFALLALFILLTLTFFLLRLAPGGPFDAERTLPPEQMAALQQRFALDQPLAQQYLSYLGDLAQGDLGPSFGYPDFAVSTLIMQALPVSLSLGGWAFALAFLGGLGIGILAARGRLLGRILDQLATLLLAVPNFVLAPLLVLLFALTLRWLPAGGWDGPFSRSVILPALALALPVMASIAVLMRASLAEVLKSEPSQLQRAFGLSYFAELRGGALKLAVLPVVAYAGAALAQLLTGSLVVEQVFGLPGLGRYFVLGALNRDYTLLLGVVLLFGALILLLQLLTDVLLMWLDPRIRP